MSNSDIDRPKVAIINYGMGNLFSVKQACKYCGLDAIITYSRDEIRSADAVILPGVGAFADAMETLQRLHLTDTIKEAAFSSKPFMGICLGMQLLCKRSYEFGEHNGLGIVKGSVVRLDKPKDSQGNILKVPQVGWNTIYKRESSRGSWQDSLLEGLSDGEYMYFVHSYYVKLHAPQLCLSMTRYGDIEFCSSLKYKNIFACQFHPERSGAQGLKIYKALAVSVLKNKNRVQVTISY